jgi:zinc protease
MIVNSTILKNKLKVILAVDNAHPLVCLQLFVRMGSAREKDEEAGFSHLTEHLVFKSTQNFPDNTIMNTVSNLGGSINAFTEFDSTCYYLTLPSKYLDSGLKILADLVIKSNFSDLDFENERSVVIEELKQYKNDPEDSFIEEIAENYFDDNPYRKPIIGNLQRLNSAEADDLRKFQQKYYVPNNCFLIVSGAIDEENTINLIDHYFLDWKPVKQFYPAKATITFPQKSNYNFIQSKISNDLLAFVLPDISESNPDSYALSLAYKAFAMGKNSRLHQKLFDEEKLIDTIKVNSLSGVNDGASIFLVLPKKNADLYKIIEIFSQELRTLLNFGLTQQEMDDNKKEMIFYHRYAYEYVESLSSSLGSEELLTSFENFFSYPKLIGRLSLSDTKKVIAKYMQPQMVQIYHKAKSSLDPSLFLSFFQRNHLKRESFYASKFLEREYADNFRVILKRVKGKPTVGISLAMDVSQLNETSKNLGINLLTSGLLLYGNEKRNYQQFINFCTTNGINVGITPQAETTSIKLKCFIEAMPISLELLSDIIFLPTFPKDYFENLKQSYLSNLDRENDYPTYLAVRRWKEMMFGKYSNVISHSGYKETIRRISLKQVRDWYQKYYQSARMTLSIVGDIDYGIVLQNIERLFIRQREIRNSVQKAIITPSAKRFIRQESDSNQSVICLGGKGCSLSEIKENTAFHVLAQIIGGDADSILFTQLRDQLGLTYSVEFNFHSTREFGYFDVLAIVDKNRETEAREEIRKILLNVKKNGISLEDLQKAKNFIRGMRLQEEESVISQAQTLAILDVIGLGVDYYKNRDKRLQDVSLKTLKTIAGKYFDETEFVTYILA